jgi:caffeoyl-CoA O-methyltransferase
MQSVSQDIIRHIDELESLRKSRDDAWQIPRVEGDLLYHIALTSNAKLIVEVGTSYGFSGLFWGAALTQTGGKLHTIDVNPAKVESSKATFRAAGLGDVVVNHMGDARQVLAQVQGPIDVAFIDADKPATRAYFDLVWPKVRHGGSVIIDNATTHKKELADFVAYVRSLKDGSSVEVAVGNGIEWTVKAG